MARPAPVRYRHTGALVAKEDRSRMTWTRIAMLASVTSAAPDRAATIERYLFDLCPRVVAGKIDLRDAEQIKAEGLLPGTGSLGWVETYAGRKQRRITVSFKDMSDKRVCKVGFGGRDNEAMHRSIVKAGEARGWRSGAGAAELGGLVSFLYPPEPSGPKIMFTHWDEFDGLKPATNAGLILDNKP
jgi:hypothetical protein